MKMEKIFNTTTRNSFYNSELRGVLSVTSRKNISKIKTLVY